jgi:hypothetical protein
MLISSMVRKLDSLGAAASDQESWGIIFSVRRFRFAES